VDVGAGFCTRTAGRGGGGGGTDVLFFGAELLLWLRCCLEALAVAAFVGFFFFFFFCGDGGGGRFLEDFFFPCDRFGPADCPTAFFFLDLDRSAAGAEIGLVVANSGDCAFPEECCFFFLFFFEPGLFSFFRGAVAGGCGFFFFLEESVVEVCCSGFCFFFGAAEAGSVGLWCWCCFCGGRVGDEAVRRVFLVGWLAAAEDGFAALTTGLSFFFFLLGLDSVGWVVFLDFFLGRGAADWALF